MFLSHWTPSFYHEAVGTLKGSRMALRSPCGLSIALHSQLLPSAPLSTLPCCFHRGLSYHLIPLKCCLTNLFSWIPQWWIHGIMHLSKPIALYSTKSKLQCVQIRQKSFRRSVIQRRKETVTGESNYITNVWNSLTRGEEDGADLPWKWVESKTKGTAHKHCSLVDKVVSHGGSGQFWYLHPCVLQLNNEVNGWWETGFSLLEWGFTDKQIG